MLNVPLEFLSRIQKVVIVMQDGTRFEVEKNMSQILPNGQNAPNADERYLENASSQAKRRAEKALEKLDNPFTVPGDLSDIEDAAYKLYYDMVALGCQFTAWNTAEDAVAAYLKRFNETYSKHLKEISGATTLGIQALIVAANKDRKKGENASSEHNHNIRAIIWGYRSLVIDKQISDDLTDEEILLVQDRAKHYHKRNRQNNSRPEDFLKEGD
jgi:hypothetical protein